MSALHTTHEYAEWLKNIEERISETNRVIRTSGGNFFWDMRTFKQMVTVLNGPPVRAWPLELRRKAMENNGG
jgi:hypothetical protein